MAKGLRKRYQKKMKKEFPGFGVLFPITQRVKLGDYGFYHKGEFLPKGNIFDDFGLKLDYFISQRIEESAEANFLLTSDNVRSISNNVEAIKEGVFKISTSIAFGSQNSYVVQLYKLKTDNIFVKRQLELKIDELAQQRIWIEEYRLVVQRYVTHTMKFAYSVGKESKITLAAKSEAEGIPPANLSLGIDFSNTQNMKTDYWVEKGENVITPIVKLVKFTKRGIETDVKALRSLGGSEYQLFEEPRLVIDNSDSFADFEEPDDDLEDI